MGHLNRNLYIMLKFTKQPKTPGTTSKKTIAFLKGIRCLQMIFVLICMKQTLIWFNLQRDGTGNGLSNIKDTFAESLQLQMSVLHQSMYIFKAGLSIQVHTMGEKNVKKVPDPSDPNQNVEKTWNSKLKFT